jgi:hypothetical protein
MNAKNTVEHVALLLSVAILLPITSPGAEPRQYEIGGPLAGVKLPLFPTQHGEPPGQPGVLLELEQHELDLKYKGRRLKHKYKPDFICFDKIILEIKAVKALTDEHRAQVHNYLKATGYQLGLLVNFGHYLKVEWERIVR